ncbi:MAG: hypothetical protein QM811_20710 [Pirellulales bacterium]
MKSLDRKLAEIHADPHGSRAFILADAKDADMAFGLGARGSRPNDRPMPRSVFARWPNIANRSAR